MQDVTFRTGLRDKMRHAHDVVDDQFSTLDLTTLGGLKRFLIIHEACFTQVDIAQSQPHPYLRDIIDNLRHDMRDLALTPLKMPALDNPLTPLAVAYIVEGSRMGTAVLRRRWAQSSDPHVLEINTYFDATYHQTGWRALCTQLESVVPGSPHARAITRDAALIFGQFSHAFRATAPALVPA